MTLGGTHNVYKRASGIVLCLTLSIHSINSYYHHLHNHSNLFQPFFNNFNNYYSPPTPSPLPQTNIRAVSLRANIQFICVQGLVCQQWSLSNILFLLVATIPKNSSLPASMQLFILLLSWSYRFFSLIVVECAINHYQHYLFWFLNWFVQWKFL